MAALLANGTRTVLVERLDRCARDLMVQESIIADFKRKGLSIVSVNEPDLCSCFKDTDLQHPRLFDQHCSRIPLLTPKPTVPLCCD